MGVIRNLTTNILNFLVNILIGLWLPPFIINRLGVEAYGLIPLANSISTYALIISISINGSIARYLILDVENNDFEEANKTFNSALWGLSAILLLLTPILIISAFYIHHFINIPIDLIEDANLLFLFVFISFVITNFTTLLNTAPYIKNRLDLINVTNLTRSAVRLISIVLIFSFISISLKSVGISNLIASFICVTISFSIFKKQTPFLYFNLKYFRFSILREILSMGGWLLISQIGALLFLQIDLIVVNVIAGAEEAGRYSILLPWNNLIRSFAAMLAGVIAPILLQYYAKNNIQQIINISSLAVKYLGVLMSVVVASLCVFSEDILIMWLGKDYASLNYLFIVLVSHLGVNLSVLPLYSISNAYKKVKIPGIVTISLGFLNVFLAVLLLKYTGLGLYGVALASFIILTSKNIFFAAPYTAYILGVKKTFFLKSIIPGVVSFLIIFIVGIVLHNQFSIGNWLELIFSLTVFFIFSIFLMLFLFSNKKERDLLFNLFYKKNN